MDRRIYTVEAWSGSLECIAFRRVVRATTAVRQGVSYVLDRGARRVIITRRGAGMVAEWNATGGWRMRGAGDNTVSAAIAALYE